MSIHDDIKGKAKGQDTAAAKAMMGRPAHALQPLLADGDTNERLEPGYDQFTVTAQDRADMGLQESEDPRWIRDPRIWKAHEMGDRARSFVHTNPGGRIVTKDGQFVTNGDDLILAAVPRELAERAQAQRDAAAAAEEEEIKTRRLPGMFPSMADEEALEEIAHRTRAELQELGLLGPASPSHGMDYEAACARFGGPNDLRTLEREAEARSNGRAVVVNDEYIVRVNEARRRANGNARAGEALSRGRETPQDIGGGKRTQTHLTGNNPIGPRNRQEREAAFAQARR